MKLIQHASQEKLNGGFYTPEVIVNFILKWAMNGNEGYDILEEIYPFMRTLQLRSRVILVSDKDGRTGDGGD